MTKRYYTYTVSHCSKAIKYGLYWLISELEKYKSEKGCIIAVGKGNFCDRSTKVYKEGLGENIVKKLCKYGYTTINGKKIEFQYPRNMHIPLFTSVVVIYPYKKLINNIEETIAHYYHTDRPYLPPNPNALPKSLLIIPWIEFAVDEWIEKYIPHRIEIDCAEYYKFGSCRKL